MYLMTWLEKNMRKRNMLFIYIFREIFYHFYQATIKISNFTYLFM